MLFIFSRSEKVMAHEGRNPFLIILTNVESCDRRIQSAINIRGKTMRRRAKFLLTHAPRQAGWG